MQNINFGKCFYGSLILIQTKYMWHIFNTRTHLTGSSNLFYYDVHVHCIVWQSCLFVIDTVKHCQHNT